MAKNYSFWKSKSSSKKSKSSLWAYQKILWSENKKISKKFQEIIRSKNQIFVGKSKSSSKVRKSVIKKWEKWNILGVWISRHHHFWNKTFSKNFNLFVVHSVIVQLKISVIILYFESLKFIKNDVIYTVKFITRYVIPRKPLVQKIPLFFWDQFCHCEYLLCKYSGTLKKYLQLCYLKILCFNPLSPTLFSIFDQLQKFAKKIYKRRFLWKKIPGTTCDISKPQGGIAHSRRQLPAPQTSCLLALA